MNMTHNPVPALLRSIAAALDELSTGDPYDYSRIPSDDARALRALADRLEKPTEGMTYAGAAAIEHLIDNFPGVDTAFCEAVAHAGIIAAIAAAGEGL